MDSIFPFQQTWRFACVYFEWSVCLVVRLLPTSCWRCYQFQIDAMAKIFYTYCKPNTSVCIRCVHLNINNWLGYFRRPWSLVGPIGKACPIRSIEVSVGWEYSMEIFFTSANRIGRSCLQGLDDQGVVTWHRIFRDHLHSFLFLLESINLYENIHTSMPFTVQWLRQLQVAHQENKMHLFLPSLLLIEDIMPHELLRGREVILEKMIRIKKDEPVFFE